LLAEWHETFTSLKAGLNELNSSILTQRLDELVASWVVEKKIVSEKPRAIRYALSKKWKDLMDALKPLEKISKKIF
jgi:DNA-binding HxlR family transcriptional regulator